jgi:hypothetical protein
VDRILAEGNQEIPDFAGVAVWTEYPIPRSSKGFGAFMNVPSSSSIHVDLLRMD